MCIPAVVTVAYGIGHSDLALTRLHQRLAFLLAVATLQGYSLRLHRACRLVGHFVVGVACTVRIVVRH